MKLMDGEQVVVSTRPHGRVLIAPIGALLALAAVVGAGLAVVPPDWRPWAQYVVGALGLVLIVVFTGRPLTRWAATRTTLTTARLVVATGVARRVRHEVPLNRITEVSFSRRAGDYGFGSGTLLLTTVAGHRLRMTNLPQIAAMAEAVSELATESVPVIELPEPASEQSWS